MPDSIRVVIADAHASVRKSLRLLVERADDTTVIAEVETAGLYWTPCGSTSQTLC